MRFPTQEFVAVAFAASVFACSDSPATPAIAPVASITISLARSTFVVGTSTTISAETFNANGQPVRGRSVEYVSSNAAVATISSSSSPTVVTAIAPGTASITASSEGKTASVSVTVVGPALCTPNDAVPMTVGQVIALTAAQKALLCLGPSTDAAEYKLVIVNSFAPGSVTLNPNNTAAVASSIVSQLSLGEAFANETEFPWSGQRVLRSDVDYLKSPLRVGARGQREASQYQHASADVPVVGAVVTLNGLSGNECSANPRSARVVGVGKYIIMYADVGLAGGGFNDQQYASMVATFDTLVYPLDTTNFGSPKDIDGNGRIGVYVLPGDPSPAVAAYVTYRDLDPLALCAGSNGGEYIYINPPDPNVVGASSISETLTLMPAVMAHELQHIINGSFHFPTYDNATLNEALSHIAEELYFFKVSGLQPRSNYSAPFGNEAAKNALVYMARDFSFYWSYLQQPELTSPLATQSSVAARGAMWNLLRYAADRKGGNEIETWRALSGTTRTGLGNLTGVFGDFQAQLRDWAVSNVTDDVVANVLPAYTFPSWNIRTFLNGVNPLRERDLVGDAFTVQLALYGTSYHRFRVAPGAVASIRTSNAGAATSADIILVRTK